ncbi:terminase gpA endonuclease subunit, partial [Geminicoccus flavidas]|uniref:terminase gpA endonuclease subunit n=1 Tax=Geminicoccus flavidas TaxID=2506407 RepID=UPI00190FB756
VALTAGVDVQNDRLELEIVGWGRDEESWSIEHQVLWGDPAGKEVWQVLDQELARTFPHRRKVPALSILAACVDSGGHHTQAVVRFCAERHRRRIWAIKGIGGPGRPLWPKRPSKSAKSMLPIYALGVDAGKEQLMRRLATATAGPGYCHFPESRDLDYFQQLTAERLVTRYHNGRPVRSWQKAAGDRNEALDCRVYAMAALQGAIALGLRLNSLADKMEQVEIIEGEQLPPAIPILPPTSRTPQVILSPWMEYNHN